MNEPIREDLSKMDEIFQSVNEASASAAKQAQKDADSLARDYEKAKNDKHAHRAEVLRKNRIKATKCLLVRFCGGAAVAALIYWTKAAHLIAPQLLPWELNLVTAWIFYCIGCWAMCMAFWRE